MLVGLVVGCRHTKEAARLSQAEFMEAVRNKEVFSGYIADDPVSPDVHKVTGLRRRADGSDEQFFITYVVLTKAQKEELLASGRFQNR